MVIWFSWIAVRLGRNMARKHATKRRGPTFPNRPPNVEHLKPEGFEDYMTLGELARHVNKDKDWLRKLERAGRIPVGKRRKLGKIQVRLYSPARVSEIADILSKMKPGRPRKGG